MGTRSRPCDPVPNLASANLRLLRPPPVLFRMVVASLGSFASLGCTTASGETCSYCSHTQSLALRLSPTAGHLARSWPYTARGLCMNKATGCWRSEAQVTTNCNHTAFRFSGNNGCMAHHLVRSLVNYGSNPEPTAIGH